MDINSGVEETALAVCGLFEGVIGNAICCE
jgi:hypothetical protein